MLQYSANELLTEKCSDELKSRRYRSLLTMTDLFTERVSCLRDVSQAPCFDGSGIENRRERFLYGPIGSASWAASFEFSTPDKYN